MTDREWDMEIDQAELLARLDERQRVRDVQEAWDWVNRQHPSDQTIELFRRVLPPREA